METPGDQTHFVKRVVLPSGRTLEVVYSRDTDGPGTAGRVAPQAPHHPLVNPNHDLHVCVACDSELVYPVQREASAPQHWSVLLRCPNCNLYREGVFTRDAVECLHDELERGACALTRDYKRLMRANVAEEIDRFVAALDAGAILPEDF